MTKMTSVYVYLTDRERAVEDGRVAGKVITKQACPERDDIMIDYLNGKPVGVEIVHAIDTTVDGKSVREVANSLVSARKSARMHQQVSESRDRNLGQTQRHLGLVLAELRRWQTAFGPDALNSHVRQLQAMLEAPTRSVVLPPEAVAVVLLMLKEWAQQRGLGLDEADFVDLAMLLVGGLEGLNEIAAGQRADAEPDTDKVWRINIEVPAHLRTGHVETLIDELADVLHEWEPQERKGWDVAMSAHIVRDPGDAPDEAQIEYARAILRAVPGCAYTGPVTGVQCSASVRRPGDLCDDHLKVLEDLS